MFTDKLFTGHQREGDLYHMGARFYDPEVGTFLQPDTIVPDYADPQSLNRYSYVTNNPMRYSDPTGRCGFDPNNAGLNNLLGLCGPSSRSSTGPSIDGHLVSDVGLPTFGVAWPGASHEQQHGGVGPFDTFGRPLGDFGLGTLLGFGDLCGGIEFGFGTSCFGQRLSRPERILAGVFTALPVLAGSQFRLVGDVARELGWDDYARFLERGGGGISQTIRNGDQTITFGHGGRHAKRAGVSIDEVNNSIAQDVTRYFSDLSPGSTSYGLTEVDGVIFEYKIYVRPDGTFNIGTYKTLE